MLDLVWLRSKLNEEGGGELQYLLIIFLVAIVMGATLIYICGGVEEAWEALITP